MAQKIEGITDPEAIRAYEDGAGYASMLSDKTTLDWDDPCESARYLNATMVVHEGPLEAVFTASEVRAIIARLPVQAMVGTPCVMLEDIAPAFGLSDPA